MLLLYVLIYVYAMRSAGRQHLFLEKFINSFGSNGIYGIVNCYANALLTLAKTKGSCKLDLFAQSVFGNEALETLNNKP